MKQLLRVLVAVFLCAIPVGAGAWWQSVAQQNVVAGGGGSLAFTWKASAGNGAVPDPANNLITAAAIGTASSDRIVVVGISWIGLSGASADITSVTIGGNAATQAVKKWDTGGLGRGQGVWYLLVTSGTTADIKATWTNGFLFGFVVNVGTITGSATASIASTVTTAEYNAGSVNATVTVPTSGVSIIDAVMDSSAAPVTTWTGTFSSSADSDLFSGPTNGMGGSMTHVTATSSTVNLTASTNNAGTWGWVGANFQP